MLFKYLLILFLSLGFYSCAFLVEKEEPKERSIPKPKPINILPNTERLGSYDPFIDQSINELRSKTAIFIGKIEANIDNIEGSYSKNKFFYIGAKIQINSLVVRAKVLEQNVDPMILTQYLQLLEEQYKHLAAIHELDLRPNILYNEFQSVDETYRDIIEHLVLLKTNNKTEN